MRLALLVLSLLLAPGAVAEVYKYSDAQGRVHYTDQPPDKSKAELILEQYSAALKQTSAVVLYGTQRCGVCKTARGWLHRRGVAFRDVDIDSTPQAQQEYLRLGVRGVPVILAGGQRMLGFNEATMLKMLGRK